MAFSTAKSRREAAEQRATCAARNYQTGETKMGRKTVEIEKIKRMANEYFFHSGDQFKDHRIAIQSFVSSVLLDCNAYRGFNYLDEKNSKPGHSIGIIFDESPEHDHVFPDDSRIFFY